MEKVRAKEQQQRDLEAAKRAAIEKLQTVYAQQRREQLRQQEQQQLQEQRQEQLRVQDQELRRAQEQQRREQVRAPPQQFSFVSLMLITVGTGTSVQRFPKPCVAVQVQQQQDQAAAAAARLLQIKQEQPDSCTSPAFIRGGSCSSTRSSPYDIKLRDSYEAKLSSSPHAPDSGYMGSPYSMGSPGPGGGGGGHTPSPSLDNLDQVNTLSTILVCFSFN